MNANTEYVRNPELRQVTVTDATVTSVKKGFGFAKTDGGTVIYFQLSDGRQMRNDGKRWFFSNHPLNGRPTSDAHIVVVLRDNTPRGKHPEAKVWTLADGYYAEPLEKTPETATAIEQPAPQSVPVRQVRQEQPAQAGTVTMPAAPKPKAVQLTVRPTRVDPSHQSPGCHPEWFGMPDEGVLDLFNGQKFSPQGSQKYRRNERHHRREH